MQGVFEVLLISSCRLRDAYAFAKLIPVYMIYAALGNSVFSFEIKNMQIGHKFDINMAFA